MDVFSADSLTLFKTLDRKKVSFLQNPNGTFPKMNQSSFYSFLFQKSFNANDTLEDVLALRTFWVTDRPFGENCSRELQCYSCKPRSWGRDLFGSLPYSNADFQRKSSSFAIPQEEHDWKNMRKWAGISRSPKSVQQVWKRRAYCNTFPTTFFIAFAITTSDHHRSNFHNNSQVLWRK